MIVAKRPCVQASKTPLADSLPRGNAILTAVRFRTASKTCAAAPFALGAKSGAQLLSRALDDGLEGRRWAEQALRDVVAGSAKGSLASVQSALGWWAAFSDAVIGADGDHFPPTDYGLACWSRLFRNANTFANYVTYLRLGSHVLALDTSASYGPLLQRAKQELRKRQGPPRVKRFIQETTLATLVEHALHQDNVTMAILYLTA